MDMRRFYILAYSQEINLFLLLQSLWWLEQHSS